MNAKVLIEQIRIEFQQQIKTKNSWGKNEIELIFERSIVIAMSRLLPLEK